MTCERNIKSIKISKRPDVYDLFDHVPKGMELHFIRYIWCSSNALHRSTRILSIMIAIPKQPISLERLSLNALLAQ